MQVRLAALAALFLGVVACGGSDSETTATGPSAPTEAPATTGEPTTTAERTTTTARATITTQAVPDYEGIIYASGTEPTYTADGITSRVAAVIVVDLSDPEINGAVADCAFQVDYAAEQGRPRATRCLVVQWSFDVAADFRVDEFSPEGGLSPGPFVGADGIQHDQAIVNTGLPGTVDNLISAAYPLTAGGTAGTLRFDAGSNLVGYTTHTFDVPTELAPIDLRT